MSDDDVPREFVIAIANALLAHIAACHAVLEAVQWSGDGRCPVCERDATLHGQHAPDCALRACLDGKP